MAEPDYSPQGASESNVEFLSRSIGRERVRFVGVSAKEQRVAHWLNEHPELTAF